MVNYLSKGKKAVANWIFIGVGMLLVQVILGGITRLTGSGLSITEWNVVTGALPPLHEEQWITEFTKYKQTPQYQLLNADFTLHNFKFIFFWEWLHRFWARLIGVVFIIGFIYLLLKKYLQPAMIKPLLILFLLGAMQGAIGWIMVKSGLTEDMVYVKPVKLALHFIFALVLICYAWWFAVQLSVPKEQIIRYASVRKYTWLILAVLFFQLIYGALMAGHKAATAAPTWPTINGSWLPDHLFDNAVNLVENKITVHFIHRTFAYLLIILTAVWTIKASRMVAVSAAFQKTKWLPAGLILLQALLGILSVLSSPFIVPNRWVMFDWLAQFHQVVGLFYLLAMVWMLYIIRSERSAIPVSN
ncbi:MAG: COX15/CtaA family protein [Chitinophagaceae bacterium]